MILVGESHKMRRKPCLSATLSTTDITWTRTRSGPALRGNRPATNRHSHCLASLKIEIHIIHENSVPTSRQHRVSITTTKQVMVFTELLFLNDLIFGLFVNPAVWRREPTMHAGQRWQ